MAARRQMRLLFVNMFYPPQNAATAHYLGDLCEGLAARGHEVEVICSGQGYLGGLDELPRREIRCGVRVTRLWGSGLGKRGWVRRLCDYGIFWVLAAGAVLRRRHPDWVVCLTSPPLIDLVGVLHRMVHRSRLAIWSMDCYPEMLVRTGLLGPSSLRLRALASARSLCAARTDLAIALDSDMARQLRGEGYRQVVCITNWGDEPRPEICPSEVAHLRRELAGDAWFLALYAGNLGRPHDFQAMLAVAEALRNRVDVRFAFRGGGESWSDLVAQIRKRNLRQVTVSGYLPKDAMPAALAAADLLIMCLKPAIVGVASPSKLYGYLFAGRPILYFGPQESEAGRAIEVAGCGWVVSGDDASAASHWVEQLVDHPARGLAMGRAAAEFYAAHYGRESSVASFEGQLSSALSG